MKYTSNYTGEQIDARLAKTDDIIDSVNGVIAETDSDGNMNIQLNVTVPEGVMELADSGSTTAQCIAAFGDVEDVSNWVVEVEGGKQVQIKVGNTTIPSTNVTFVRSEDNEDVVYIGIDYTTDEARRNLKININGDLGSDANATMTIEHTASTRKTVVINFEDEFNISGLATTGTTTQDFISRLNGYISAQTPLELYYFGARGAMTSWKVSHTENNTTYYIYYLSAQFMSSAGLLMTGLTIDSRDASVVMNIIAPQNAMSIEVEDLDVITNVTGAYHTTSTTSGTFPSSIDTNAKKKGVLTRIVNGGVTTKEGFDIWMSTDTSMSNYVYYRRYSGTGVATSWFRLLDNETPDVMHANTTPLTTTSTHLKSGTYAIDDDVTIEGVASGYGSMLVQMENYTNNTGVRTLTMITGDDAGKTFVSTVLTGTYGAFSESNAVKYTTQTLTTDEQAQARANIGAIGYDESIEMIYSYGIQFDTTISTPVCTRIGNTALHKSLPIHNNMRGCLLADDGSVNEYLPSGSWVDSTLDGTTGQVMVEIPAHYRKFVTDGTVRQVWISEYPLQGYDLVPKMYVSAYEASLNRTTTTLASVANSTADYRGGGNNTAYDDTYRSFLGRPATSISLTDFRTYARKRKSTTTEWNCMTYEAQKTIFWLFVTEYATLNSQSAINAELTTDGYKQGGLGDGVTTISDWGDFNGSYPFIPCGYTNSLGNGTGEIAYDVINEDDSVRCTVMANRYRGLENPFGHIWQWTDGILVDVRTDDYDGNYAGQSRVLVAPDPANFASHSTLADSYEGYEFRGLQARTSSSFIKEIIFGEYGDMMGEVVGGSSTTFFCDYNYTSVTSSSMCGVRFGGYASNGSAAGFAFSRSDYASSNTYTALGSRLCFHPAE